MVHWNHPPTFVLRNICDITGRVFELKENPRIAEANSAVLKWFEQFNVYDKKKADKFLNVGKFDIFAALSFPEADLEHLTTCLIFFLWAFATDDLSDEGEFQSQPDQVQHGHDISCSILDDDDAPQPDYPYAAMLWDLLRRLRSTGHMGMYKRFKQAFLDFSSSQVQQSTNRNVDRIPPVDEFILMRRKTIGAALVEAMVEYSLDLDIPSYVWEHPVIVGMSQATSDIMTWPNDLCSFNKEQADGDYQNLVCVLQHNHGLELQEAIDLLTKMISDRVQDYVDLKNQLPSFGPDVDPALHTYLTALEQFVQGTVVWYYSSPRYFRHLDPRGKPEVLIHLFPKTDAPTLPVVVQEKSRPFIEREIYLPAKRLLGVFVNYVAITVFGYSVYRLYGDS
uniref:Terpene synthase n=1 Tax=Clitopilus sp. TaxID=1967123 RepID=A0A4P2VFX4_9AGAR|nr:putative sesquiterpene synthase [Clitopilus sp.]